MGIQNSLGFSRKGLDLALQVKNHYENHEPLCLPGTDDRLLIPEHLLNGDFDLQEMDEPLPLAMVAVRDPESSMAVAAAVRLSPMAGRIIAGVKSAPDSAGLDAIKLELQWLQKDLPGAKIH